MIRIDPPLPLLTPRGLGMSHFLIDYGLEHDLLWVVFITETGECWTFKNSEVRMEKNLTIGRRNVTIELGEPQSPCP